MGFCGTQSVKSLDDLANVIQSLKIVNTRYDATQFINTLNGRDLRYTPYKCLRIDKVIDTTGKEAYRIMATNDDY